MSLGKKFPTLRWPGAKAHLAPVILNYVPKRGRKFIDLFAGRANVTLRAIAEGFEYGEWVLNDTLTAPFLRALRDHGDKFKATERSRAEFERLAELAKNGDPHALLMEPYLCFNGGTFARGCSTTDGGHRTPKSYEDNVHLISELLREKNVRISADDWLDCLQAEQLGPDDLVFIDFPYIGCDVGDYSAESICPTEIIEYLKTAQFQWVMTEYDQPLYRQAFGKPVFQRNVQLRTTNFADTGGQERRTECIWTNIGKEWAKRDTVTFSVPDDRTDTYYVGLPLDELLREIKECVAIITAARNQMNAEMRNRLLLALKELKKRTFRKKPGYQQCLVAMGLNPDTVRQWFYRSRTADEVIELLEEETTDQPDAPDVSLGHVVTMEKALDQTAIQMDCIEGLNSLVPGSADVIVFSPPYNIGLRYSGDETGDNRPDYLDWMQSVSAAYYRALSAHGHCFLQVGGTPTRPLLPFEVVSRAQAAGFKIQNRIVWVKNISIGDRAEDSYGHCTPTNSELYLNNTHEFIFHLTKTGREKINKLAIGVPYKDKSNIERFNRGEVRCRGNVWFISIPVSKKADRYNHPAPYPVELPAMCIKLAGVPKGSLVVDPFVGIGTTLVACKELGMRGIGFDNSAEYCGAARDRLAKTQDVETPSEVEIQDQGTDDRRYFVELRDDPSELLSAMKPGASYFERKALFDLLKNANIGYQHRCGLRMIYAFSWQKESLSATDSQQEAGKIH